MTRREQKIFEDDIQRRYTEYMEQGDLGHEECLMKAQEEAEAAYDDAMDSKMEEEREKSWE